MSNDREFGLERTRAIQNWSRAWTNATGMVPPTDGVIYAALVVAASNEFAMQREAGWGRADEKLESNKL